MPGQPIPPRAPRASQYGIDPALVSKRAAELPGICSLTIKDLFPDAPATLDLAGGGRETIRRLAEQAMASLDLSQIKPEHSVNILCSHHGFTLLGGEPYVEMLRTIKDVIEQRTGARNIRLRAGVGLRFRETEEYIKSFGLDTYFKGKAIGIAPVDAGVAIETEIGTLYGIRKAYDADWIIHAHNSDVREIHFHREVDRAVKPFAMSYARIESRSTYHQNMGPRAANFVARAIFDSPFVQSKHAGSVFLIMSPAGVVGVDADNDLYALNDRVTIGGMKYYGKVLTLLGEIDKCIAVLDFPAPVCYVFAAGVIYANFVCANWDLLDLDDPLPPYTWYTEAWYDSRGNPMVSGLPPVNPAIKMAVHNYAWIGYPVAFFSEKVPTVVVGQAQKEFFDLDPQNLDYMKYAKGLFEDLDGAMSFAYEKAGTDNVIIFDGAVGGLNVSRSLADLLTARAPLVSERVDKTLMPKWLRQRGLDISQLDEPEKRMARDVAGVGPGV